MNCHVPRGLSVSHRCPSCNRLLGLQTGPSLHIKHKDFHVALEGRASLRCRCGVFTVVVTGSEVSS